MKTLLSLMLFFVVLCLCLAPPPAPAATAPDAATRAAALNDQGKTAYAADKYTEAIELFQQAAALDPGEIAYVTNLATSCCKAGQYAEALAILTAKSPLFSKPDDQRSLQIAAADTQFYWGQAQAQQKAFAEALPHYQAALVIDRRLRPKDAGYDLDNLAAALYALGRNVEVVPCYREALALRRTLHDTDGELTDLRGLSAVLGDLGQYAESAEFCELVLTRLLPDDRDGRVLILDRLAECYKHLGQTAKAQNAHRRSAALTEADALNTRGVAASKTKHYAEAAALSRQAMTLNPASRVYVINLARNECSQGQYAQAATLLEMKLPLFPGVEGQTEIQNEIADTHYNWGAALEKQKRTAEAIPHYMTSFALDTQWRPHDAPLDLHRAALAEGALFHFEEAQTLSGQEAALYHALADPQNEATALSSQAAFQIELNHYPAALEALTSVLALSRAGKFRAREGDVLLGLGHCLREMGRPAEAADHYQQALMVFRELGDHTSEASALRFLGNVCSDKGSYPEALDYYAKAETLFRTEHNLHAASYVLNDAGLTYSSESEYEKAISCYRQAMAIQRSLGDESGQGTAMGNMAMAYSRMGRYQEAIRLSTSALTLYRRQNNAKGESDSLNNLGSVYSILGRYDKAIPCLLRALAIQRTGGIRRSEAVTLGQLGTTYRGLGQYGKALTFYQEALAIAQKIGDRSGEASALNNMGLIYDDVENYDQSTQFFQQALTLHRTLGGRVGEASVLSNIGNTLQTQHRYEEASGYYRQSIVILREIGSRNVEAQLLNNLGTLLEDQNRRPAALDAYQQALEIHEAQGDLDNAGTVLGNLLSFYRTAQEPRLAIFYGKQAINLFQTIRGNVQSLDKDAQKSYLATHAGTYRMLAGVMIEEGRLDEAQQVLGMLKEEEFFDFLGRDPTLAKSLAVKAALTPFEAKWFRRGHQATSSAARQSLRLEMPQAFRNAPRESLGSTGLSAGSSWSSRILSPGVAAVYTIVAPTKLFLIVTTAESQTSHTYPIAAPDLYRKVLALRNALQDPTRDPRPLSAELYKIIVGPIEADLKAAHPKTLLWSLDDALRYLPISALYDGHHYLVERYDNALLTLAAPAQTTSAVNPSWTGLGLGVSREHPGFDALPGVRAELSGIFGPVVPGTTLLDTHFTQASFLAGLKRRSHPLVHIASHFSLSGRDTDSFLLLGDGGHLSLADLKADPNVFAGVDLLTLSACNTAMEVRSAGGKEVEGFGALAQRLGARSVLASLWPVADASTPVLMREFYRLRHASRTLSKASGLREAQLELLRGKVMASMPPSKTNRAKRAKVAGAVNTELPLFTADPHAPYAHPYYWAPFVLIGNPQ